MKFHLLQKVNQSKLGRLFRRGVALSLALSMTLPNAALAYDAMGNPVPAVGGEAPTITIEANAVVDRWYDPTTTVMDVREYLTGDLEVAIRVQSGKIGDEWQAFDTIGVALKYSPILTPYKFTLINGIDLSGKTGVTAQEKKDAAVAVDLTGTQSFTTMTTMQTLKSKNIATATGHVSGEPGKGGCLFMEVEANRPLVLKEDTVLAVVTFRYDLEKYQIVAADAEQWLTPLTTSVTPGGDGTSTVAEGDPDPDPDPAPGTDPVCLLQFATRAEMDGRYGKYELEYTSANNDFFYSADPEDTDINLMQLDDKTTDLYHGAPTPERVNFRLVNQTTYNDGGLTLDDLAIVLFYDWDDTIIGALIVPRDGDARKLVNDYVRDNFIHEELRNTDVTSRKRIDNYRGKYPATEPMADGAVDSPSTIIANGDATPLTNKLDYVFFKRPMEEAMVTDASGDQVLGWRQTSTEEDGEETASWDTDYPYLHGWAIVPDYRHPEDIWTTLGMGEVLSYSGALNGGYQDTGTTPATLIAYNQEFIFADFNFARKTKTEDGIETNSLEPGSIYAVKAVYEPGEDLLNSIAQYRMIHQPYYNKLNSNAANAGGAYSVDLIYERASTEQENKVRGVARIRDIVVRQDSTPDLKWEDPELNNATQAEADDRKSKSSYSPVTMDNGESVIFNLALSARFNRIDYYLIDRYNNNFVAGQKRTGGNAALNTKHGADDYADYVLWNYNYFTDDSERDDIYYDVLDYEDRDGSLGFVLKGTLNNLVQHATSRVMNPSDSSFNTYVNSAAFLDSNIRTKDGAKATVQNQGDLRTAVLEATRIAAQRQNDPDFWNAEMGYAELTYHQLQLYIMDPSRGLLSREDADKQTIIWCNLHDKCVNERTGKPVDWKTFIAAARGQDPYKLEAFTNLDDAESLTHLRKTVNGGPFADRDDFIASVRAAVATLPATGIPTWDQVQAAILGITLPSKVEDRDFWWYDGSTSAPRLISLASTVTAAQDAIKPVKLPDDSTMVRYDKLNQLKTAFEENAASTTVAASWNNATKNLCITKGDSQGEKFDTFADFRAAFADAVAEAEKAGITLEITASAEELKEYWQKLQYRILNPTKPYSPTYLPEMGGYWWYNGNSKIGDLASLLAAAKRALPVSQGGEGDSTILDMFTLEDLYKFTDLHFRKSFKGEKFVGTGDLNAFIGAVKQFVQLGSDVTIATSTSTAGQKTTSWNHLQYYLIHSGDAGFDPKSIKTGATGERTYYWWRDGKDGEVYALTADAGDGFPTLLEAVYRTVANGNPKAYDQLTAEAVASYRQVSSYTTEETWDALPKFGADGGVSMDALKASLAALYGEISAAGDDYKEVSWRQVQHYLLGKGYVSNSALAADNTLIPSDKRDDENGYWWREGNEKPGGGGPVKSDLDYFLEEVDRYINDPNMTDLELAGKKGTTDSVVDRYLLNGKLGLYGGSVSTTATKPLENLMDTYKTRVRDNVLALAKQLRADPNVTTCVGILDWYVLQYYSIYATANKYTAGNPIKTHEEAVEYYVKTLKVKTKKDWVPAEYRDTTLDPVTAFLMMPSGAMLLTPEDRIAELTGQIAELTDAIREEPELAEEYAQEIAELMAMLEELRALLAGEEAVAPTETPVPPASPIPTESAAPTESPAPTESAKPTESPEPTETAEPDDPIGPEASPEPTEFPEPTETVGPDDPIGPTAPPEPTDSPEPTESVEPDDPIGPAPTPDPTPSPTPEEDLKDPEVPAEGSPEPTESSEPDDKEHLVTVPEEVDPPFLSTGQKEEAEPEVPGGEEEVPDTGGTLTTTAWTKQKMTLEPAYRMWYTMVEPEGKGKKSQWRTLPILCSAGPPGRLLAASPPEEIITLSIGRTLT